MAPLFPDEADQAWDICGGLRLVDVVGQPLLRDVALPWTRDLVRAIFGALGPRYRPNASFMSSIDTMNEVRGFDTSGGLSNQTVDLTQPYNFQVLGRPYYENSGFPDFTGTTGAANILVVGDFRNYVIFDRIGSRVEFIPHLMGANNRPSGQRGLYFWWRVGGKTVNTNGFRLLLNS
jgi:HK97 family phage major capsid protein